MDLRNCKRCGRMFQYIGKDLCERCRASDEDDFKLVKEFLRENPGASVPVVVDKTGVKAEKIIEFLREDRLEIKGENGYILNCESCGTKIASGRFCRSCISNLQKQIGAVTHKPEDDKKRKSERDKFRIADRYIK